MKKFFLFLTPFLIGVFIFFAILFFLDRKTGKGALQITSSPGSKIYLNDKLVGKTPLCYCDVEKMLPVGDYSIKLVPVTEGFNIFEEKITLNKGALTVVDRTFESNGGSEGVTIGLSPVGDKKTSEIMVVSFPDKANVFLDSNPVGITPLLLKQVSASDHDLKIKLNGYKEKIIKIKTALGFRLNSIIYLGVNPDLSISNTASLSALEVASPSASVVILDTPTGFLRVREDSSVSSKEIGKIKPGESYKLTEEKENWFKIEISSSASGWISSSYAAKK